MSTRSMIALKIGPDKYKSIYCHYDGYLTYVGAILLDHYNTKEKLEKLLELGDLSSLDIKTEPDPNLPHSFDGVRQDDVCVAYGRDRGETGTEAKIMTLHELVNVDWIQYVYILGPDNEWNYYSYNYDDMENLRNVKEDLDMNSPQIEDLEDMYALYQRACYIRIMWYIGGLVLLAAVLPTALVRIPINTGVPDLSAKLCASRRCVALGKVLVYCLLVLLLSLLTALIQSAIYASSVMNQLGLGYCLRCLVWRMLQDLAVLSIPLYIAFLCHNAVLATVLNLGYGCLCCWLNILAAGQETVLFIPFPAFLHGLRSLWQPEASPLWLVVSALVSLGYILVFGWLSVRQFAKAKTQP